MGFISYALLSFVSYSGIFFGSLLIFIAPEEQKPGRKYFLLMQKMVLGLIIIVLLYNFSKINLLLSILLFIFAILKNTNNYFVYLLFIPLLYISFKNTNLALIMATLIFLYGLSAGSLLVKPKYNFIELRKCIRYIYYPILTILIFLLYY